MMIVDMDDVMGQWIRIIVISVFPCIRLVSIPHSATMDYIIAISLMV